MSGVNLYTLLEKLAFSLKSSLSLYWAQSCKDSGVSPWLEESNKCMKSAFAGVFFVCNKCSHCSGPLRGKADRQMEWADRQTDGQTEKSVTVCHS